MKVHATNDLDYALGEGELWRMHVMRRTLWIVDSKETHVFDGAAARAVATKECTFMSTPAIYEIVQADRPGIDTRYEQREDHDVAGTLELSFTFGPQGQATTVGSNTDPR